MARTIVGRAHPPHPVAPGAAGHGRLPDVGVARAADEKSDFEKGRIAYVKKDYVEANARFQAMLDPEDGHRAQPRARRRGGDVLGRRQARDERQGRRGGPRSRTRDPRRSASTSPIRSPIRTTSSTSSATPRRSCARCSSRRPRARGGRRQAPQRERGRKRSAKLEGARRRSSRTLASEETVDDQELAPRRAAPVRHRSVLQRQRRARLVLLADRGRRDALDVRPLHSRTGTTSTSTTRSSQTDAVVARLPGRAREPVRRARAGHPHGGPHHLGVLGALALTGILEAQIDFVAERSYTRPRKLPEDKPAPAKTGLRVWPSLTPASRRRRANRRRRGRSRRHVLVGVFVGVAVRDERLVVGANPG